MIKKGNFLPGLSSSTLINNAREVEDKINADISRRLGRHVSLTRADIEFSNTINDTRSIIVAGGNHINDIVGILKQILSLLENIKDQPAKDKLVRLIISIISFLLDYINEDILEITDYNQIKSVVESFPGEVRSIIEELDAPHERVREIVELADLVKTVLGGLKRKCKANGVFIADDKVIIFIKNIEDLSSDDDEIEAQILSTLIHELFHHVHYQLMATGVYWHPSKEYKIDYADIIIESLARYYQKLISNEFIYLFPDMKKVLSGLEHERYIPASSWSYSGSYYIESERHFLNVLLASLIKNKKSKCEFSNWVEAIKKLLVYKLGSKPRSKEMQGRLRLPA